MPGPGQDPDLPAEDWPPDRDPAQRCRRRRDRRLGKNRNPEAGGGHAKGRAHVGDFLRDVQRQLLGVEAAVEQFAHAAVLTRDHQRVARQFTQCDAGPLADPMIDSGEGHQPVREQRMHREIAIGPAAAAHPEISLAGLDQFDDSRRDGVADEHGDAVMPIGQPGDRTRQQIAGDRWQAGDRDDAAAVRGRVLGTVHDRLHVEEDAREWRDELASELRQGDVAIVAIEKPDAESAFELANLHGQRRLRDVELSGGAREVAAARDRQEGGDVAELRSHMKIRILQ